MKAEILSRTDYLTLPLVSVVLFTAIFLLVLAWIFRPGAREAYAKRARMALDAPESHEERDDGAA